LLTGVGSFPNDGSGTGENPLFQWFVVAESKFLNDMVEDLVILRREIHNLLTGIMHIRDYVGFAPFAVGRKFQKRLFGHFVGQFDTQAGGLAWREWVPAVQHYFARGKSTKLPICWRVPASYTRMQ